jgi:MFS family permease
MGLIRAAVGFLTVLLAFDFRGKGEPKWHFAVVGGISVLGALAGSALAPRIRKVLSEEQMLIGFLAAILGAGLVAALLGGLPGACLIGAVVGIASTAGKMAFDSIVQRDAPDANRGRSFARFEARFQVLWVIGALLGLVAFPLWIGYLAVAIGAGLAAFFYGVGSLAWRHRTGDRRTRATETAVVIDDRIAEVQQAAKRGLRRSARRVWDRILERDPSPPTPDEPPTTDLGPFPPPPPDRVDRPN